MQQKKEDFHFIWLMFQLSLIVGSRFSQSVK